MRSIISRLSSGLREHRFFVVVVLALTAVMTFPSIVYVFKTDVFWLPTDSNGDVFMKFWDAWHVEQVLAGRADFYFTDALFHPDGLSLMIHVITIPHALVLNAFQLILPPANAFSLTYLLIILCVAWSSYLYILYLAKDKQIATLGAVIVGLSPHVVGHANQPDVNLIASIPLSLYFFHRGIVEGSGRLVLISGLIVGFTVFISLYVFVCGVITLGIVLLCLSISRWKMRRFWIAVSLCLLGIAVVSAVRLYPMVRDTASFEEAMSKGSGSGGGHDILGYFVNVKNPFMAPVFQRILPFETLPELGASKAYLGYTTLTLMAVGLLRKRFRLQMLPWALLLLVFLVLGLGSILNVGGIHFPNILLPKYYLNKLVPGLFEAFWATDIFVIGALLPLAIVSCYGALTLMQALPPNRRSLVIALLIALVAFEFALDKGQQIVPEQRLSFLEWLGEEPGPVRVINLPMGRRHSKIYQLYQALSGIPHAEGLHNRTPSSAYDYIKANDILNAWHAGTAVSCRRDTQEEYLSALDRLDEDGFSHVIVHHYRNDVLDIVESFQQATPSFSNDHVSIYPLRDLRESCPA